MLITGASEGIGAACATAFERRGARISLLARTEATLAAVGGPGALRTVGDVTREADRRRCVESTLARFGTVDVLVNNAGRGLYVPSWQSSLADARELFDLNLFAPLAMTQLVVPHMRAQRRGTVVNVGSIAGKLTLPWLTLYSASKSALGAWTDGLRRELRRDGVHAISVCPGYVHTAFQQHVIAGQPPAAVRASGRLRISADECAAAIVRAVERDARTVVIPRLGWLYVAAERLAPRLLDRQLDRYQDRRPL